MHLEDAALGELLVDPGLEPDLQVVLDELFVAVHLGGADVDHSPHLLGLGVGHGQCLAGDRRGLERVEAALGGLLGRLVEERPVVLLAVLVSFLRLLRAGGVIRADESAEVRGGVVGGRCH